MIARGSFSFQTSWNEIRTFDITQNNPGYTYIQGMGTRPGDFFFDGSLKTAEYSSCNSPCYEPDDTQIYFSGRKHYLDLSFLPT